MYNIRTDLAVEIRELYQTKEGDNASEIDGVTMETKDLDYVKLTKVQITNDNGAKILQKPIGTYITLDIPNLTDNEKDINQKAEKILAEEINSLASEINYTNGDTVLVVGLGNWNVTPDALGPKVIDKIAVTRHLKQYASEFVDKDTNSVCAVAPGVLGITGIETAEVIKGIVEKVKPSLIIAIDALASRRLGRISTTIQISDTGIIPGSGVGNTRAGINEETLGVPVIAIGIPTVVDAVTIASDAMDILIDAIEKEVDKNTTAYMLLNTIKEQNKENLMGRILDPYIGSLVVTPKEIDSIITNVSNIVGNAINIAVHGSIEKAQEYLN